MNDKYTDVQFEEAYEKIYNSVTKENSPQKYQAVVFLGGQPGTGKTSFVMEDEIFDGFIVINGDEYRKYHPFYDQIQKTDLDNMASRTQEFVNACVERLIEELSDEGYNLIIEGTLRDSSITINTCNMLKNKGYSTDLYVIALDAMTSWQSTINRANIAKERGTVPRIVPIEKYNYIVNHLSQSISEIEAAACFDNIHVVDRDNKILFPNLEKVSAAETVSNTLKIDEWNSHYQEIAREYSGITEEIVQAPRRRRGR